MSQPTISATISATTSATVLSTIEKELDLFSTMYETLEAQQQNILSRDGQSMSEAAQTITQLLGEAQQYRTIRSSELKKAGFNNSPEGMTRFCRQHESTEYQEDWQELVELVERCKALNLENGETLKIQQSHTQRQLQRLTRRQEKTGYTARGQSVANAEPTLRAQA